MSILLNLGVGDEVKIVEGQSSTDSSYRGNFGSIGSYGSGYDAYEDDYGEYDDYGAFGGYHGNGGYWNDADSRDDEDSSKQQKALSAKAFNVNVTGPLMMIALQDQCFVTEEIPGEGKYSFCPYRNISLTYMMRRSEESLSMGTFSHWTTQNLNGTVRLAQVYTNGFYCRMGDEHNTLVTYGCQGERDPYSDADGSNEIQSGAPFQISSVTKGTYNKENGKRASVNGTFLKGEADYWGEENTGCVYKLHFLLPFSCEDLGPLGFAAASDPQPEQEGDSTSATVSVDGAVVGDDESEVLVPPSEVLVAWRAWGVRLKDGLGASADDIERLQEQLEQERGDIATANAAASDSESKEEIASPVSVSDVAATSSFSSSSSSSSLAEVKGEKLGSSCSCCDELDEVKTKLKQMF